MGFYALADRRRLTLMSSASLSGPPRIALTGWYGSDNLGDELILRAMTSAVRARGAEPLVVTIKRSRPAGSKAANPGADEPSCAGDAADGILHRSPVHHLSLTRSLRDVGAMAVSGGVMQAETSVWNVPFHTSRLLAASTARCRIAAIGLGVGAVPDRFSRGLIRRALRPADVLVVRDRESAARLHRWGLHGVAVGADPVLAIDPIKDAEAEDTMCVILRHTNRRGLLTSSMKSRRQPPVETIRGLARAIDAVASATGLTPRFVAFQSSQDDMLHRAVARRLKTCADVVVPTLDTVLSEVARSRLVITMRYHGAVAALLHNRPAVLLDYSPKMASLAAEGGGWAPAIHPERITADRLNTAAAAAFDSAGRIPETRAGLRARLAKNDTALDALAAASGAAG